MLTPFIVPLNCRRRGNALSVLRGRLATFSGAAVFALLGCGGGSSGGDPVIGTNQNPTQTPNAEPLAVAGDDQVVEGLKPVTFRASASSDPDGDPLTFTWDFGDRSKAVRGEVVTHHYSRPGDYVATLKVSDGTVDVRDTVKVKMLEWEPRLGEYTGTWTTNEGPEPITLRVEVGNPVTISFSATYHMMGTNGLGVPCIESGVASFSGYEITSPPDGVFQGPYRGPGLVFEGQFVDACTIQGSLFLGEIICILGYQSGDFSATLTTPVESLTTTASASGPEELVFLGRLDSLDHPGRTPMLLPFPVTSDGWTQWSLAADSSTGLSLGLFSQEGELLVLDVPAKDARSLTLPPFLKEDLSLGVIANHPLGTEFSVTRQEFFTFEDWSASVHEDRLVGGHAGAYRLLTDELRGAPRTEAGIGRFRNVKRADR